MKLPHEPKPEHIVVLRDSREASNRPSDQFPFKVERATLPTADWTVKGLERVIAIETKWSLSDLVSCVGSDRRRFDAEMLRLAAYPCRALIIASSWPAIEMKQYIGKVTPTQITGALCGWASNFGIPFLLTGTVERAEQMLARVLWVSVNRRWKESRELIKGVLQGEEAAEQEKPNEDDPRK